jgi:pre-mRNA cleavage complex 2 protein Pcf11
MIISRLKANTYQAPQHYGQAPPQLPIHYQSTTVPQVYQMPQQPTPVMDYNLHRDVENLITLERQKFAANLYDSEIQVRLKALLDLQTILKSQRLSQPELQAVQMQVRQLQAQSEQRQVQPPAIRSPPPQHFGRPAQTTYAAPSIPTPSQQQKSLAELLAAASRTEQPTPSPANDLSAALRAYSTPVPPPMPHMPSQQPAAAGANSLLDQLRSAGLLSATTTPVPPPASLAPPALPAATPLPTSSLTLQHLQSLLNASKPSRYDIELTTTSLKMSVFLQP